MIRRLVRWYILKIKEDIKGIYNDTFEDIGAWLDELIKGIIIEKNTKKGYNTDIKGKLVKFLNNVSSFFDDL
jgi:hypothetical protein